MKLGESMPMILYCKLLAQCQESAVMQPNGTEDHPRMFGIAGQDTIIVLLVIAVHDCG
jgi:hypothetical protein